MWYLILTGIAIAIILSYWVKERRFDARVKSKLVDSMKINGSE